MAFLHAGRRDANCHTVAVRPAPSFGPRQSVHKRAAQGGQKERRRYLAIAPGTADQHGIPSPGPGEVSYRLSVRNSFIQLFI